MRYVYGLSFEHYYACLSGALEFVRVGKTPIVRIERTRGDLPFWRYFQMALFFKVGRWLTWRADVIDHEIRITNGSEKDIVWRKRDDGMYQPYDSFCDVELPYLARKAPPVAE